MNFHSLLLAEIDTVSAVSFHILYNGATHFKANYFQSNVALLLNFILPSFGIVVAFSSIKINKQCPKCWRKNMDGTCIKQWYMNIMA